MFGLRCLLCVVVGCYVFCVVCCVLLLVVVEVRCFFPLVVVYCLLMCVGVDFVVRCLMFGVRCSPCVVACLC